MSNTIGCWGKREQHSSFFEHISDDGADISTLVRLVELVKSMSSSLDDEARRTRLLMLKFTLDMAKSSLSSLSGIRLAVDRVMSARNNSLLGRCKTINYS